MLRISYLILCLVAVSRQLSITDFAVPGVIKIGENAELQCRYSFWTNETETKLFYMSWWWTPLNSTSDNRQRIYQRLSGHLPQEVQNRVNIDITIKENDTVELLNLQPSHSGIYECEVSNIDEVHEYKYLIVYTEGSGPLLNISAVEDGPDDDEEHDVLVSCEASDVAPEPDLVITLNGREISTTENVSGSDDGLYNITATATLSKGVVEGAKIRCELFFKNENISHEVYDVIETYSEEGSEAERSTTEAFDQTTQEETATESFHRDGACALSSILALFVATATLAQLVIH